MTNVSAVEKMAELMQQIEVNSPRVAALHYCLSETSRYIAELEQKLAKSQREFRAADATIENLQMKLEKMAAENAGLKALARGWANATDDRLFEEHGEIFHDSIDACEEELKTICPATDAFLAEVRAQGVEMLRDSIADLESSIEDTIDLHHYCSDFAAEIRKGVQS
ncbi:hypothetical protein A3462_18625 [Enterobacter bugandensis]|uniref:hypothetical protein n=1 Tax=Enterobacter bugandensis TaxID=881260 RepID=UPI0007B3F672|nr:hypothetical protein [Enterobacter bugandensis]KZP58944.1 hypothetical protein A3462_18625 [Enterobacter bugandensis]